ncbi:MAG: NAD+ synthase, partial [Bacteroidota bacterium]
AQLNYHIGNFESNSAKIIDAIKKASDAKCDLIVFAELAVCGYPPLDFLDYKDFIGRCTSSINKIAEHCKGITAIVGAPVPNPELNGKNIFNAACVLSDGKVSHVVAKTLLPTYDVFDEYRWFESGKNNKCFTVNGCRIALTVCEDLWNMDDDPLYTSWPMDALIEEQPQIMINIAASPFNYLHAGDRKKILEKNIRQYHLPLIYVNQVGAHTDILFDGGSLVYNANAEIVVEGKYFEEDFIIYDVDTEAKRELPAKKEVTAFNRYSWIEDALVMGIRDYFGKMGFKKAILGLSGGIDSALVTVLAARALGAENVHAVLMPSQFSSSHSISDSEVLVKNLGVSSEVLPISGIYDTYISSLEKDFRNTAFDVTEENLQARIRGVLLMALSNKFGYILLNTSNKSELAVGYGTLYGDMCGGLSVIGDLYKTDVFALCRYINRNKEVIPENIITKPPSAELRPDQKDSDSLPAYDVLDDILLQYIEEAKSPGEIIKSGHSDELVMRVLKMVNRNEYKRYQAPPILRISPKAFGRGRRMPLVAKYLG